jgi:hypothetical protein
VCSVAGADGLNLLPSMATSVAENWRDLKYAALVPGVIGDLFQAGN